VDLEAIDEHSPRGDHEFVFDPPPGFADLSSDDKAAAAPFVVLRQSGRYDEGLRFYALATPPQRAVIDARVQRGRLRILPNTPDQLRFSLPATVDAGFVGSEILTLSETRAVRLDYADAENHCVWFWVPGRIHTANIKCACPRDQLERYEPLFLEFANKAARGAETATKTWGEIEQERTNDPRRAGLGLRVWGTVVGSTIAGGIVGGIFDLNFELAMAGGAFIGIVIATIVGGRGQGTGDGDE
jgi:hypothetical protein